MNFLIKDTITQLERFNDSIREALDSKKISNTREAANSLRIEYGEDFAQSIGVFYLEFLDTGRGPGKFPPLEPLIKWAKTKFNVSDREAKQIAYLTGRKIAALGTEIFLNNNKGIELNKKIVTLRENLRLSLPKSTKTEILQRLDYFKQAHLKNKYQI